MANARILVVDDDIKIVHLVQAYLKKDGYEVLTACNGLDALDLTRQKRPDLIVLDLMLPEMDGLDICRLLRGESNQVPIIMLTARTTEEDRLVGLETGADDYVTKPFSPRELLARVRAVLRRTSDRDECPRLWQCGDLQVDITHHQVRVRGASVYLTPKEFKLLETLIQTRGRVFTRLELLDQLFGYDYEGLERTVDTHIMNLRRKIEPDPGQPIYVETVFGLGYRFAGEAHDS